MNNQVLCAAKRENSASSFVEIICETEIAGLAYWVLLEIICETRKIFQHKATTKCDWLLMLLERRRNHQYIFGYMLHTRAMKIRKQWRHETQFSLLWVVCAILSINAYRLLIFQSDILITLKVNSNEQHETLKIIHFFHIFFR